MSRRPRLNLDGVPLHLVQRGHNRQACFFAEGDYHACLHGLGEALRREAAQLHAYALMTNHMHLLLTPQTAVGVARIVIAFGRRYVEYINKTYRRIGTLWDSPYKSSPVQAETHFLLCQRYIELNPVRAALVDDPAQYRWSSYRHNGLGKPIPCLRLTRSTFNSEKVTSNAKPPNGLCLARNWTAPRSTTSGWRSTRISLWVMRASSTRSSA